MSKLIIENNEQKYNKIKYNQTLTQSKKKLITELEEIKKQLEVQKEDCDHIKVCLGWNGPYQYRDTSICECLFCRESDPETNYPLIDASYYKDEIYSHGELSKYRESRMIELQNIAMYLLKENPNLSYDELISRMNIIIKDNGLSIDIDSQNTNVMSVEKGPVKELTRE